MELSELASILLPIAGMFLWNRSEANADRREMHQNLKDLGEKMQTQIVSIREEIKVFRETMQEESKEFHARLCVIESNRKTIILNGKVGND